METTKKLFRMGVVALIAALGMYLYTHHHHPTDPATPTGQAPAVTSTTTGYRAPSPTWDPHSPTSWDGPYIYTMPQPRPVTTTTVVHPSPTVATRTTFPYGADNPQPSTVYVPQMMGMTWNQAVASLTALHLDVHGNGPIANPAARVVAYSPTTGTAVPVGSTVQVTVNTCCWSHS